MAWKIDEIDRKILEILRENAQLPNEKLGKKVGLSEPAARRRVANLVSRGVIRRFTIDVEEGGGIQALVFLSTAPHISAEKIVKQLATEAGIGSIWETSGDMDIAVTISAPDMDALNKRIDEMRALDVIRKTKTSIIMKKWR
jgi:DNA-binding Lrp family transcriptional regulator